MGDAWFFGPLMIQEKWALYVIAFIVSYIVVRFAIKFKSLDNKILDSLWNALFLYLVVWKLSYALFHPIDVFKNPISQLYFTGGEKGAVLAFISVSIYFLQKSKSKGLPFHVYMETGLISVLTSMGVFQTLTWIGYFPGSNHMLLEAVFVFILVVYWFITYGGNGTQLWTKLLLWFSLGELFISFFKPQIPMFLGFSFSQGVYIVISLLVIVVSNRNFTKT